jgi:hypothetical protein
MQIIDKNIKKLIELKYTGEVLETMLRAFELIPTYKSDCTLKRLEKEYERRKYVKEKLNLKSLK